MACNLACSDNLSSVFISFNFSILLISFCSCSASNFLLSKDNVDSASNFEFVSSIFSLSSARSFAFCSDLKPSTVASTAITSFFAVIKATSFSVDLFLSKAICAALKEMFAFFSMTVFCSSRTSPSLLLAAIRSSIEFLSSSLICLCCSACLSYFSSNPAFVASAISADLASCTLATAASFISTT